LQVGALVTGLKAFDKLEVLVSQSNSPSPFCPNRQVTICSPNDFRKGTASGSQAWDAEDLGCPLAVIGLLALETTISLIVTFVVLAVALRGLARVPAPDG